MAGLKTQRTCANSKHQRLQKILTGYESSLYGESFYKWVGLRADSGIRNLMDHALVAEYQVYTSHVLYPYL